MINSGLSIMDYIVTISGSLILVLLGAIGWFLKQFATSVKDLKSTVEQLRLVLSVEQEKVNNIKEVLTSSNNKLEDTFIDVYNRLDMVEKDVAILKFQHS